MNAFERLPSFRFLLQLLVPLVICFELAFYVTGYFVPNPTGLDPHFAARAQQDRVYRVATSIPNHCLFGGAASEFQEMQCGVLWRNLAKDAAWTAIPFVFVLVVFLLAKDSLSLTYKRARQKIAKGKALFSGTVTHPAAMNSDFYGWFYCLKSVSVQHKSGHQVRVYLSPEQRIPEPGATLAIFEGDKAYGRVRLLGMPYAPHVAVVRGGVN